MPHFYNPWKRQKTKGFLAFSGGIEMGHISVKRVNVTASLTDNFYTWARIINWI